MLIESWFSWFACGLKRNLVGTTEGGATDDEWLEVPRGILVVDGVERKTDFQGYKLHHVNPANM